MEISINENVIKEGGAEIITGGNVFYNPVQEFNRDLSISVLNIYSELLLSEGAIENKNSLLETVKDGPIDTEKYRSAQKYDGGMRILEALSATGLRSIRYAKEVQYVREIIANDLSKQAVDSIRVNVLHNNVQHLVEVNHGDAM